MARLRLASVVHAQRRFGAHRSLRGTPDPRPCNLAMAWARGEPEMIGSRRFLLADGNTGKCRCRHGHWAVTWMKSLAAVGAGVSVMVTVSLSPDGAETDSV